MASHAAAHQAEVVHTGLHVHVHPSTGQKVLTSSPGGLEAIKGVRRITERSPTNSTIVPGGNVNFRLSKGLVSGIIRSTVLEFTMSETGGLNNVDFCGPVPYFITKLDISLSGSAHPDLTIYPDELFNLYSFIPKQSLEHISAGLNLNEATYQVANALPVSSTQVYRIPLYFSILNGLDLNTIHGKDLILDFTLSPIVSSVNAGTLSIDSMRLKFETFYHPSSSQKIMVVLCLPPGSHLH